MIAPRQHILNALTSRRWIVHLEQRLTMKDGRWVRGLHLVVALAERIVVDKAGIHMGKPVAPWNQMYVEVAARD